MFSAALLPNAAHKGFRIPALTSTIWSNTRMAKPVPFHIAGPTGTRPEPHVLPRPTLPKSPEPVIVWLRGRAQLPRPGVAWADHAGLYFTVTRVPGLSTAEFTAPHSTAPATRTPPRRCASAGCAGGRAGFTRFTFLRLILLICTFLYGRQWRRFGLACSEASTLTDQGG